MCGKKSINILFESLSAGYFIKLLVLLHYDL